MYQFVSRVRYSETNEDGELSLIGIINYLQDCTSFQSEAVGSGIGWLRERDRVWMLSGLQLEIYRRPRFLDEICVITKPYAFQGILGYRYFEIRDKDGELLVFANSVWCYVQPSAMRPARLCPEDMAPYEPLDPAPARMAERKLKPLPGGEAQESFLVRREHLDTNHHVNNGQYARMASDYLPQGRVIRRMSAEYRNQALLGDRIVPAVSSAEDRTDIVLGDGGGKVYAVFSFQTEERPAANAD